LFLSIFSFPIYLNQHICVAMRQIIFLKKFFLAAGWSIIITCFFFIQGATAQPRNISGAWTGYVQTSQKRLTYEVVINDSSGVYIGYSKIIFNVKDKSYFGTKTLQIRLEDDNYVLEEMEMIADNFEDSAPRKIKQINTLSLSLTNSKMIFNGNFKTKATMGLKAASGEVYLEKAIQADSSALFRELSQMGKTDDLYFVKKAKADAIVAAEKKRIKDSLAIVDSINLAKINVVPIPAPKPTPAPVVVSKPTVPTSAPAPKPAPAPVVVTKPTAPTPAPAPKPAPAPVVVTKPTPPLPKPAPVIAPGSAADLKKRNIETIQTVYFNSDSLKLTLYDNGEVDGDTVSVVVNGKVIMGKKGLSTNAITETLYITPDLGDSLQMIMYAENLGKIAPNTGLLIIQDGKDRYEIRFSGDLNKNAAIIFKRKR